VLASGSAGNSALVATEKTRILIDAGLSLRELKRRLDCAGTRAEDLDGIVVTHEHCDHISGLATLVRWRILHCERPIPVYVSRLTAATIDWGETPAVVEMFQAGSRFAIGDIEVDSFTIPHDAIDPVGLCLRAEGIKIGIVTDLGYITESVKYHLRGCTVLLLEANHDLEMLKVGPYPWSVKQRLLSRLGHLSNDSTSHFLRNDFDSSTAALVLGHLSEHNNHPEIVRNMACRALERRGAAPSLSIADQRRASEVFEF